MKESIYECSIEGLTSQGWILLRKQEEEHEAEAVEKAIRAAELAEELGE